MCSNGSHHSHSSQFKSLCGQREGHEVDLHPAPMLSIQEAQMVFLAVNAKPQQLWV